MADVEIGLQRVSVTSTTSLGHLGLLQCVSVKLTPVSGFSNAYARSDLSSFCASRSGSHTGGTQTKNPLNPEKEKEKEEKNRTLLLRLRCLSRPQSKKEEGESLCPQ